MRSPVAILLVAVFACGGGPEPAASQDPGASPDPTLTPTPVAPSAAAALTVERLDGAAECDGLLPDRLPAAVAISRAPAPGATCAGGLSDGTGHVAVSARTADGASWQVFAPNGTAAGALSAWPLHAEPSGFQGLVAGPADPLDGGRTVTATAFGPDGGAVRSTRLSLDPALMLTSGSSLAADPLGGSLGLVAEVDRSNNHWSVLRAVRLDVAGAPRWPEPVRLAARSDPVLFLVAGVSRGGEALALWQHSADVDVAWLDGAGAQVATAERVERAADALGTDSLSPALELVPLLDGSLAVRADGTFRRAYPRRATTSAPLPAWLAARAGWSLRITRGNRGYALLPPAGQAAPGCAQAIELRAPSGRLCGQVVLHPARAGDCVSGAVDQGWDGTVVQQDAKDACGWRFWPGLLGG